MECETVCRFYLAGKCRFGTRCKFIHCKPLTASLIRHAESIFNERLEHFRLQEGDVYCTQANETVHFNQKLIDCDLTFKGQHQASKIRLHEQATLMFVSPLERALQTATIALRSQRSSIKEVIVLPQLTQVLSKICDFSSSIMGKVQKYPDFQFEAFFTSPEVEDWQNQLVDPLYSNMIVKEAKGGKQFMKILAQIFPTPLQDRNRCLERSRAALAIIKAEAVRRGVKNVIIVSHNRILRYIDGRQRNGNARSFENCEIRQMFV